MSLGAHWSGGGLVAKTTGKVFFSLGSSNYVCSGSVVDAPNGATVMTAGHCVRGATQYATNRVFVPGYDGGAQPFGVFPARSLTALPGFNPADQPPLYGLDLAVVKVGPNVAGQSLQQAVGGGQPVAFDATSPVDARAFGFPQEPPYVGNVLEQCAGTLGVDPGSQDLGLRCDLTGGSSGGPWLADLDPATGVGRIVSLTSFSYLDRPGTLYGPPLGDAARQLFTTVANS